MSNDRKDIIEFLNANTLTSKKILIDTTNKLLDAIVKVIYLWVNENENASETDRIGQCNFQMIVCNVKSILLLSKGITVGTTQTHIFDTHSAASILRSLYERVFIYHNIFISTSNKIERDILLYLWEIKGMNNRTNLQSIPPKFLEKIKKEKTHVENLRKKVEDLIGQLNISSVAEKAILNTLQKNSSQLKGFKFIKNEEKDQIVGFQVIPLEESPKHLFNNNKLEHLYKYLSFSSHPSFLSTLQFGQRYNNGRDIYEFTSIILSNTYNLLCIASYDFCRGTTNACKYWPILSPHIITL